VGGLAVTDGNMWHARRVNILVVVVSSLDAVDIHAVLGQCTRLVETERVQAATNIDSARTDAEHSPFLQSILGEDDAAGHGGREGGRYDDCDKVEGLCDTFGCVVTRRHLHRHSGTTS